MKFKLSKKRNKVKSIKTQLTMIIVVFVLACCLFLGAITSLLNYKTANTVLSETVVETTKQASENISAKIKYIQNVAIQTGIIKEISNPEVSIEEKQSILSLQEKQYGLMLGQILDVNGIDIFSGKDYSERDYFKISITGKEYMSSPVISKVTGKRALVVSAPIWEGGIQGGNVVGVVTFDTDENLLNDIVKDIKISENSYAYLINKEGTTIAHENESFIIEENIIQQSKSNPDLIPFAQTHEKLISGEIGYSNVKLNSKGWQLAYAPVADTDGWGMCLMTDKGDFLGSMYTSMMITFVVAIIFTAVAFVVAIKFANKIGNPLNECSKRLEKLANGDLNSDVPSLNENYEIGLVADATNKIVVDFREMINTLTYVLTEISDGNLDIDVNDDKLNDLFANDFEPMLMAINKIVDSLNKTLHQINLAGEEVANSSNQVSEGAQLLSQGATEQASSVQELLATMNEVSAQIKQTAENAEKANKISSRANIATSKGKAQMQEMVTAMDEISNTSNEIGKIIKNIDDIAFQTNILALNAAVEAARAGAAGKGFAVVADEVRNLASKSAESAKDTATLIEKALTAIDNGTKIVSETAKSLDQIVVSSQKSSEIIQYIADASNEQAQNVNQANIGVEQISVVVQTNSATAEESAAASEELSSQAEMLKNLIDGFNLKS